MTPYTYVEGMRMERHRAGRAALAVAAALVSVVVTACSSTPPAEPENPADATGPAEGLGARRRRLPKAYQMVFDGFTAKTGVKIQLFMTN